MHAAPDDPQSAPYAYAARIYRDLGWQGVLPLPVGQKSSPPSGYTGETGSWPTNAEIDRWVHQQGGGNVGLRLPDGIIGIDVDHYGNKRGGDTIAEAEQRLGPLPPTWVSSARGFPSGIRFYRVPSGREWHTVGDWIDILQRKHRYACVWPSTNPKANGSPYLWLAPGGEISPRPPAVDEPTLLPSAWVDALDAAKPATVRPLAAGRRDHETRAPAVDRALANSLADLYANRHDTATAGVMALVRLRSLDYPGADDAIDTLRTAFLNAVTGDGSRGQNEAEREWDRMVTTGETKAATTPASIPRWEDRSSRRRDNLTDLSALVGTPAPTDAPATDPHTEPWDDPEPLDPELGHGPPFPVGTLPAWIGNQVRAVAESKQVPVDLPAVCAMGALSSVAMTRATIDVSGTEWKGEGVNLYLLPAYPSGGGKSPTFASMFAVVEQFEAEQLAALDIEIREATTRQLILAKRAKEAQDSASRGSKSMGEALEAQAEADAVAVPQSPELIADDATPEALTIQVAESGGRAAVLSAEGDLIEMVAGQYTDKGKNPNQAIYLKGYSGDPIRVKRIGRAPLKINRPTLTICVMPQSGLVKRLGTNESLVERGITARFLYAVPEDNTGWRDHSSLRRPADAGVRQAYEDGMLEIARRLARQVHPMHTSPEATSAWINWLQETEVRLRPGGDLREMSGWVAKLRTATLRTAGLLHLADGEDHRTPVSASTFERAFVLADYWIAHARAVHTVWFAGSDPVLIKARRIVEWLESEDVEEFSASDLQKKLRRQFDKIDATVEPLTWLVEAGWLRALSGMPVRLGFNKRTSPRFLVHPRLAELLRADTDSTREMRETCGDEDLSTSGSRISRFVQSDNSEPTYLPTKSAEVEEGHCANARNARDGGEPESPPHPVVEPAAPADPDDDEYGPDWSLV